jgi:branched-chain amino acid transport system substrate-binding protein
MKKSILLIPILLVILIWVYLQLKVSPKINIGILSPMSGNSADYGKKCQKAIYLSQSLFDKNQTNLIFEDTQASPKKGILATQKLIKRDNVVAIIGGILSSVTIPTAQISEKNKVIQIATTSSSPKITHLGNYIYRVWPSDEYEGKIMAEEVIKKYKRIAILYMNNDYGLNIGNIFANVFQELGGEIIYKEAYSKDENSFKKYLIKIKNLNIPALYIAGYYKDTALIAKQSHENNYKPQFYGTTAIEDEKLIDIGGKAVNGFIYPIASEFEINANDISKRFYNEFITRYTYKPGWVESHCFDASMLIFDAVNKGNASSSNEIKNYIDKEENFLGATGTIIFDKNGDVKSDMVIKTIIDGKFK